MSSKQVAHSCYTNEEESDQGLGWLIYRHVTHANMFNPCIISFPPWSHSDTVDINAIKSTKVSITYLINILTHVRAWPCGSRDIPHMKHL
jgi:hypothetical protein